MEAPGHRERDYHRSREDPRAMQVRNHGSRFYEGSIPQRTRGIPVQIRDKFPRNSERRAVEKRVQYAHRHEEQPRTRHEHERRHHKRREKHVNFLDEERPARLVAKQKAVAQGLSINLKLKMISMYPPLTKYLSDPNASCRTKKRAVEFLEFHGQAIL